MYRSMCVSWCILGVNIQWVNGIMWKGFSAYSMCVSWCVALGVRLVFFFLFAYARPSIFEENVISKGVCKMVCNIFGVMSYIYAYM